MSEIRAEKEPFHLEHDALPLHEGEFGPRRIFLDDGQLYYQRGQQERRALEPFACDLFRVGDLEYFRLRFDRDETGRIMSVTGLYDSGDEEVSPRS